MFSTTARGAFGNIPTQIFNAHIEAERRGAQQLPPSYNSGKESTGETTLGLELKDVVPWGRTHAEYAAMFGLQSLAVGVRILDCAGGPSSFNVEETARGGKVVSADPLYRFPPEEIQRRIEETRAAIVAGLETHRADYVWNDSIPTPEALGRVRMGAMRLFLDDFVHGKAEGRYVEASLPELPFADRTFDLALCSHFLFTYARQFDLRFHVLAIQALCRVAKEARLFPLLALDGAPSADLDAIVTTLNHQGFECEIRSVEYEFQRGAHQMLCVHRS